LWGEERKGREPLRRGPALKGEMVVANEGFSSAYHSRGLVLAGMGLVVYRKKISVVFTGKDSELWQGRRRGPVGFCFEPEAPQANLD